MAKKHNDLRMRLAVWQMRTTLTANSVRTDLATETTAALTAAGEFFQLDPAKDAAVLLRILADVVFSERKRGRRSGAKKWDHRRVTDLSIHLELLGKDRPGLSDSQAAAEIKRRYPQYRHDTAETIRRRLPYARTLMGSKARAARMEELEN